MFRYKALGVLLVAICVVVVAQAGWAAESPLSLNINTSRTVVTQGDYVEIKITLKNTTDREFNFGVTEDAVFDYALEVFGPDGSPTPKSKSAVRRAADPGLGPSHSVWISFAPGQEQIENVDMEALFDLSAPGTYSIQALWSRPGLPPVRSNVIVLTVKPEPASNGPSAAQVLASAEAVHPRATLSPCSLNIETDRPVVSSGRAVGVSYALTNTANRVVQFAPGTIIEYAVEVRDEDGALLPDKAPNAKQKDLIAHEEPDQNANPRLAAFSTLRPGGRVTGGLDVARYVDLTRPGIYSIQFWRRLPKEEGGAEVRSNVIVVTIKPAIQ